MSNNPNNPNQAAADFTALIAQLEAGKGKKKQKNTASRAALNAMTTAQRAIAEQKSGKAPSTETVEAAMKGTAEDRTQLFHNPKCSNALLKQQLFVRTAEGEKPSVKAILLNPSLKPDSVRDWYAANSTLPFVQGILKDEGVMTALSSKLLAQ
jgi:hypothetical protein